MKMSINSNLLITLAIGLAIYATYYYFHSDSPSLNERAMKPDVHLLNVRKYVKDHEYDRARKHLTKAIETMRIVEQDIDIHSGEVLERTIDDLEKLRPWMNKDSIAVVDLNTAISNALSALSMAELRVSESYAETNKLKMANVALRYGMLHLRHAMEFSRGDLRERERHIFKEVDSLLKQPAGYSIDMTLKIDHMVKELEELLAEQ